jgi:hypothetical protein
MVKTMNARFEVEKFNGHNNLEMWNLKVWDFLVQQGLHKELDNKRDMMMGMSDDEWEDLNAWVSIVIQFCLADDIFNIRRGNKSRPLEKNGKTLHEEITDQTNLPQ